MRQVYAAKMATSTPASISVIERRSGSVSEYAVARARNASSIEWLRSRRTSVWRWPRRRHCHQATKTTIDEPLPKSSRFDTVMLARAREHGEASVEPGGTHDAPWAATAEPPVQANTTSTASSGKAAERAST